MTIVEEKAQALEYLQWALAMIDNNFKETGEIGFAEVIAYKAAKNFLVEQQKAPTTEIVEFQSHVIKENDSYEFGANVSAKEQLEKLLGPTKIWNIRATRIPNYTT